MLRSILGWLIEHQAVAFGWSAGTVALLVAAWTGLFKSIGSLTNPSFRPRYVVAPSASAKVKPLLAIALLAAVGYGGYVYGRTEPISGTVIGMPDLTCGGKSKNLVLFLHGWRGDPAESWKDFPNLVCGDREINDVDVLSIGYPTYLIGNNLGMRDFSKWLADELVANHIAHYDRIAMIAHSIGGLITRGIVLEQRPELKNIGLVIEMATPHTGPRDYAQLIRIGIAPGTRLVGELTEGSPYLTKLRSDWDALPARPDTHCWWSSGDALVTEKSAHEGCALTHVLPTFDHRELVKPVSRVDDRYTIPMDYVKTYF